MLLVSGATATVRRYSGSGRLGKLLRPGNGNGPDELPWAADNGAFKNFQADEFRAFLSRIAGAPGCMWVAVPDVVADHAATLKEFRVWEPTLHASGFPVALVSQDGLRCADVPWEHIECLFVGGTDRHKLGDEAVRLARETKRRDKLLHLGRVNSVERIRYAHDLVADSFDGGQFSMFPDTWIPWALERMPAIERSERQMFLCDAVEEQS
jgi:hypothetical protein